MAGIYIHIPFCKQRCLYCAFYSSTLHSKQQEYCDALCREIIMRRNYIIGIIDTVYFGGGTPSTLTREQLQKILGTIKENYRLSPSAEITIEANPDDLTPEYLATLRSLSFNRLSMGIQSFDDAQLKAIGRRHTAERARQAVKDARTAGFENISIDLMFALPSSTSAQWQESIKQAIELRPTHISAYNLTYEEETPLYKALQQGKIEAVDEEENLKQFEILIEQLAAAGYRHYEISNFALPGYESRHNSSYWHDIPYLGCGAAAHSYNGESRSWNISDIKTYIEGINNGAPFSEVEQLTTAEQYNDAILTRLRTADGVPSDWMRKKFGDKLTDYMLRNAAPHIAAGRLKEDNGILSLTREGLFVSDAIIRDLIYVE
ncbi:MAG: radical SAM family heme chaperone HemW [Bacteroidaceae bacterium]|nr:radical SAM family heme chaperone HemW [Bacteroidaceae bacterium]